MADFSPPSGPSDEPQGPVFTLSPWTKRSLGALIDLAPVIGLYVLGSILDSLVGFGFIVSFTWIPTIAYLVWQWYQQGVTGQTIGKKAIGIKLVRESDAQVLDNLSIARGFLHIIDALPCCVPIGFLMPLWDNKRQTIADKIVKSVVIDVPSD